MAVNARSNIPSPRGLPYLGNIFEVEDELPIRGLERLCDVHGPIVKLNMMGRERIIIGNVDLLDEVCDEKRFAKGLADELDGRQNPNAKEPKGLFLAPTEDDMDWQVAHRVLIPAFGPLSILEMFPEMHDIASQLVLKWARMGPSYRIPASHDFTRLTLDTIALCAMDYRFNSFYQDETHPFVQSMNNVLTAAFDRGKIGPTLRKMMPWDASEQAAHQDRMYTATVANELVKIRRENPTEKNDLLNAMIKGKDPKTGQPMSDGLIIANMITFLVAGHETTSALLAFTFIHLLKNPGTYFKAQQEVDRVIGRNKMTAGHLKDLKYINAVLRETLRLSPPTPIFPRIIRRKTSDDNHVEILDNGKYAIYPDDKIICVVSKTQRDPKVYGDDADQFKPERMLDEHFLRLPKAAWKPFGNGARACIGRPFAWQEALMCISLILQNFDLRLDDPNYEIKIKQTITIKPEGFFMRATLRKGITAQGLQTTLLSNDSEVAEAAVEAQKPEQNGEATTEFKPMTIIYGSNTGTCTSLAQKLSSLGRRYGFKARVMEMDAVVGHLPTDQPVAILTSSYEGHPPDNAGQFVAWLEALKQTGHLGNVTYAVFGCGHTDWAKTYQRIPKLVDELIAQNGGKRFADIAFADASGGDMFGAFDVWADEKFWSAIGGQVENGSSEPSLEVEISSQNRTSYLRQDVKRGIVVETRRLTALGEPEKRHMKITLHEGMTYETGDYLAILPLNSDDLVARTMKQFKLLKDATITIKPGAATFLPTGTTLSVLDLLKGFVELNQPATKQDVLTCMQNCSEMDKARLKPFSGETSNAQLAEQRISVLDLLIKYPSIDLPFGTFLSMLPPLRPRHYSISSSALADPLTCTITYGVIEEAAKSGIGQFAGVTGSYLSTLKDGDEVLVSVRGAANKHFRLPADQAATPLLMFGAGTGLAPFRAFIEERAIQIAAGKHLAPAVLVLGCRSSRTDRLYAEEMDGWVKAGVVDVRYAFSREPEKSEGCKYIHERFLKDKKDMKSLWERGAKVFTCCAPAAAESFQKAAQRFLIDNAKEEDGRNISEEYAAKWFAERRNDRVVFDVFA